MALATGYTKGGGGPIEHLAGGALGIPSFTDPAKRYTVHPESGYCSCERHRFTGRCKKHIVLGRAIESLGESLGKNRRTYRMCAEEHLFELCKRIYAPLKNEHYIDSYNLLLEVLAYRHASEEMVKSALIRHHRALRLADRRAA